jgi:hypothetical protein
MSPKAKPHPGSCKILERGCRKEDYAVSKKGCDSAVFFPRAIVWLLTCVKNSEYLLILLLPEIEKQKEGVKKK